MLSPDGRLSRGSRFGVNPATGRFHWVGEGDLSVNPETGRLEPETSAQLDPASHWNFASADGLNIADTIGSNDVSYANLAHFVAALDTVLTPQLTTDWNSVAHDGTATLAISGGTIVCSEAGTVYNLRVLNAGSSVVDKWPCVEGTGITINNVTRQNRLKAAGSGTWATGLLNTYILSHAYRLGSSPIYIGPNNTFATGTGTNWAQTYFNTITYNFNLSQTMPVCAKFVRSATTGTGSIRISTTGVDYSYATGQVFRLRFRYMIPVGGGTWRFSPTTTITNYDANLTAINDTLVTDGQEHTYDKLVRCSGTSVTLYLYCDSNTGIGIETIHLAEWNQHLVLNHGIVPCLESDQTKDSYGFPAEFGAGQLSGTQVKVDFGNIGDDWFDLSNTDYWLPEVSQLDNYDGANPKQWSMRWIYQPWIDTYSTLAKKTQGFAASTANSGVYQYDSDQGRVFNMPVKMCDDFRWHTSVKDYEYRSAAMAQWGISSNDIPAAVHVGDSMFDGYSVTSVGNIYTGTANKTVGNRAFQVFGRLGTGGTGESSPAIKLRISKAAGTESAVWSGGDTLTITCDSTKGDTYYTYLVLQALIRSATSGAPAALDPAKWMVTYYANGLLFGSSYDAQWYPTAAEWTMETYVGIATEYHGTNTNAKAWYGLDHKSGSVVTGSPYSIVSMSNLVEVAPSLFSLGLGPEAVITKEWTDAYGGPVFWIHRYLRGTALSNTAINVQGTWLADVGASTGVHIWKQFVEDQLRPSLKYAVASGYSLFIVGSTVSLYGNDGNWAYWPNSTTAEDFAANWATFKAALKVQTGSPNIKAVRFWNWNQHRREYSIIGEVAKSRAYFNAAADTEITGFSSSTDWAHVINQGTAVLALDTVNRKITVTSPGTMYGVVIVKNVRKKTEEIKLAMGGFKNTSGGAIDNFIIKVDDTAFRDVKIKFLVSTAESYSWSGDELTVTLNSSNTYGAAALQTLLRSCTIGAGTTTISGLTVTYTGNLGVAYPDGFGKFYIIGLCDPNTSFATIPTLYSIDMKEGSGTALTESNFGEALTLVPGSGSWTVADPDFSILDVAKYGPPNNMPVTSPPSPWIYPGFHPREDLFPVMAADIATWLQSKNPLAT